MVVGYDGGSFLDRALRERFERIILRVSDTRRSRGRSDESNWKVSVFPVFHTVSLFCSFSSLTALSLSGGILAIAIEQCLKCQMEAAVVQTARSCAVYVINTLSARSTRSTGGEDFMRDEKTTRGITARTFV